MQIISSSHDCISFDRMKPATCLWGTRAITAPLSASRRFRFIVFRVPYSSFDFLSISHAIRISYLSFVSNIDLIEWRLLHQIGKSSHATIRIVLYQSLWLRLYEFFVLIKYEVLQSYPLQSVVSATPSANHTPHHFYFSFVTLLCTFSASLICLYRLLLSKVGERKVYIRKFITLFGAERSDTTGYTFKYT
jgi:hypothetical protein